MNETLAFILEWVIKGAVLIAILLTGFAYTTYFERRFLARIQIRVGPNRAGPFGLLQPVADGIKLIFKEEVEPAEAYRFAFLLAPVMTMVPAVVIMAVIPWGDKVVMFGREIALAVTDLNVGVLYLLSIASISVYGIVLAGWSSNNKYAMMGGIRSTAQMISYELALGLSFVPPILLAGSLSMSEIIQGQQSSAWYIVYAPLAAIVCFIALLAEVNRAPFDMVEAEQELVAGYVTEYSGMKFALFFMGEYIKMAAVSAIFATMFLGGFDGPGVDTYAWLGPIYLFLKIFGLLGLMIWIRATLPRLRYDRLMAFGWKVLIPIALLNVFITAALIVGLGI
ncbi:MAG: NADH-quinone oxidoreductase subunit NuoH [Chloroflexi bacterium]|jgi:NADH-quinone oxidoreductase subunit H|nr:NADH-quinone oxidoreductase subunit NuoH [Chloroflexota bacterium]MBT3669183.1 NADH-quinone oxidoreductase subunit NuoH [Chloroflexota bacterium]MBT4002719.1 NADH-quinone oxidoreductase subunit NuoH [Chloroflexota bacterium]MBT4306428.1 NADH-quinone oxidoreductase subunit NuoH [Chloroflexota bacterium]MBT4534927.1 NADH-quinone oxidoreductase subunit NuoH [Chloroflexota bacterium]